MNGPRPLEEEMLAVRSILDEPPTFLPIMPPTPEQQAEMDRISEMRWLEGTIRSYEERVAGLIGRGFYMEALILRNYALADRARLGQLKQKETIMPITAEGK